MSLLYSLRGVSVVVVLKTRWWWWWRARQRDAVVGRYGNKRGRFGQWNGADVQRVLAMRVQGWILPASESRANGGA
jgi:hypothetical protein